MTQWKEEVREISQEMAKAPQILSEEIPDIDLYMDQLTTYLDRRLGFYNREAGSPFVTNAMVNNYSKARLLPPSVHKRYSKIHVMMLSLVCQLKRILSMQDLGKLLGPMKEERQVEGLYKLFLDAQQEAFSQAPQVAEGLMAGQGETPEERDRAMAAMVAQLAATAQRDMMMAERLLDILEARTQETAEEPSGKNKKAAKGEQE